MFNYDDKKFLYCILNEYLSGLMEAPKFCDEFYLCFDRELDLDSLSEMEMTAFKNLSEVIDRFSQFDDDIKNFPGIFSTEKELRKIALETYFKLNR